MIIPDSNQEFLEKWDELPTSNWPTYSAQGIQSFVRLLETDETAESPEDLLELCCAAGIDPNECHAIVCDSPMLAEPVDLKSLLHESFDNDPYDYLPVGWQEIISGLNEVISNTVFGMKPSGCRIEITNGFIRTADGWVGRNDNGEIITKPVVKGGES
jgi:hypothetical protein